MTRSLALLTTFALCAAAARAQFVGYGRSSDDGAVLIEIASAPQAAPEGALPGGPAAAGGPRLERLKALEFDRRPSAILSAWVAPPEPEVTLEPATDAEAPDPAEPEAGAGPGPGPGAAPETEVRADSASDAESGAGGAGEVAARAEGEVADEVAGEVQGEMAAEMSAAADAEARAKAEADAEQAKRASEAAAAAAKALERELAAFQRCVTLGQWDQVESYLGGLPDAEHAAGYTQLLTSLQRGPALKPQVPPQGMAYLERNRFAPADVLGLAGAAPRGEDGALDKEHSSLLGQILDQALDEGHQLESFLSALQPDAQDCPLSRRELARVLVAAERPLGLDGLLPAAGEAEQAGDREALNLIARHALARHAEDAKTHWLEEAWTATLAALAAGEIEAETKQDALRRAVEIAPKLRADLGQAWLDESFTARPERGMEILAAIGTASAQALQTQPLSAAQRLDLLELQHTAAESLLAAAPELAGQWSDEMDLLAGNWLCEANVTYQLDTSTSRGPRMHRDVYGNFFYFDGMQQGGNAVEAIATGKLLELRPGEAWLELVSDTLRPRLAMIFAQLLLKISEEAEAFPYIESLASSDPRTAKQLVDEFLRVWAQNHDPNQHNARANSYVFFYGFEQRANAIPLTRSKQERNLSELAGWVARLRELPVEVDDALIVECFKSAHSSAEVYRVETLERIFGALSLLDPGTLASLVQQMRSNLADVWRDPAVQEDGRTNRRQKDIQAEVLRGYELARATIDAALADHAESWELMLARAALEHDENNYRQQLERDAQFAERRESAFATFARAAELYAAGVAELELDEESALVYETWFQAALGACDLRELQPEQVLVPRQVEAVRAALAALPGERSGRHVDMLASQIFARMSALNPGVKFRYVRESLKLVGAHELAAEARALCDYYGDLVTEIELRAAIDGSAEVGHEQPFGVRIDLRHTAEIERESGGFAKYLQNQNNQSFGWNYGRPLEDYRDKFEEATRETLGEHFEVLSVTFNAPEAHSRADAQYGWRVTPYAYVLLQARGPEVDALPALRLDLDFLDTTGYAVLPVESAVLPLDASAASLERPFQRLGLTQVLDERQAKDGKLLLEVKATAVGLLPELDALLELSPEGFEVVAVEDGGQAVLQFDEELDGVACERNWTVELRAREGLEHLPAQFAFATPRVEAASSEHFRYVDADLASVAALVELEREYGDVRRPWLAWLALVAALGAAGLYFARRARPPVAAAAGRFRVPDPVTPFSVLGLLRDIHANNGLDSSTRGELEAQIDALERHFFAEPAGPVPDLGGIAEHWSGRAR